MCQYFKKVIQDPIGIAVEAGREAAPEPPAYPFKHTLPAHVMPPLLGPVGRAVTVAPSISPIRLTCVFNSAVSRETSGKI